MRTFVGRERELAALADEFDADRPSLAIVFGRRRIGKSALIRQAATRHGTYVYFQATKVEDAVNIRSFKDAIADALGPNPVMQGLMDWESILSWLAMEAREKPKLVVVIDEFSYLTGGKDILPSIIQRFIDSGAMGPGMMKLVLCGSVVSHMQELLSQRNPLFRRQSLTMPLGQMPLRDAALFFPEYSDIDIIHTYSAFGGVPYYLEAMDPNISFEKNVERLLMTPTGLLYNEPELLMQTELRETSRYSSIIAAIASGATKLGEVVSRAGLKDGAQVTPYLEMLQKLGITEQRKSFGAGPKEKDTRYAVIDPLFRFWYRFVQPSVSAIERGLGAEVLRRKVGPEWTTYMGDQFEEICREHVRLYAQERMDSSAQVVGKHWAGDHDLDVVGTLLDGSPLFGECKWTTSRMRLSVLENLRRHAAGTRQHRKDAIFALFSKSGYEPGLEVEAGRVGDVLLYNLDELIHTPAPKPEEKPSFTLS